MGGDQHRHPTGGELADHVQHLGHELRVEGARDLVEQEQVGLHRERPHDRDTLLLAARQPVRVGESLVGESEPLEELRRPAIGGRPVEAKDLARPERHVVQDAHVREQVERLEDDPDPAPDPVDVDASAVISSPSTTIRPRRSARAG